ncbi:hypothetical protein [Muricauda sp. MAR_2010_75]|uniref:hypothetical protein n=1 Tax=Allomuricauda sp. MAR_2010_75 TaxID=1250232 RepID=UPI001E3D5C14|nr:hypothetical protein [Muricauda sp. MAR_2010_75]
MSYLVVTMGDSNKSQPKIDLKGVVKDSYGSPEELAKILDLGVVMLFYLEEDTFSRREVQSVVEALKGIGEWLRGNGFGYE